MRSRIVGLIAIAVAMTATSSVPAQPIQYFFADSNGNFTNSFEVPLFGTVAIQIYVRDNNQSSTWFTGPNPAAPGTTNFNPNQTNNLDTYGLAGAGIRITSSVPGVGRVLQTTDVTYNPALDTLRFTSVTANAVNASAQSFSTTGAPTNGTSRVLVGTFLFTNSNGVLNQSTQLTLGDQDSNNQSTILSSFPTGQTSWNGGAVLDAIAPTPPGTFIPGLFNQTATIFTPVPEPTSMILAGVGLAGLGLVRRFRRK